MAKRRDIDTQELLSELASRAEHSAGSANARAELAESFRRARQALESVTRDIAALRRRGAKPSR